ncbi:MAG: hypothetical protein WCP12_07085 [bacterium]
MKTDKNATKIPSDRKVAYQKKYGEEAGSLLLKYKAKIGAHAKHKASLAAGAATLIGLLILPGCGNSPLQQVKDGVLDLNKSTTVGKALDNYRFFKDGAQWTVNEEGNGRTIVKCAGEMDFSTLTPQDFTAIFARVANVPVENLPNTEQGKADMEKHLATIRGKMKGAKLTFEFILNKDATFQLQGGNLVVHTVEKGDTPPVPFDSVDDAALYLSDIYENRFCAQIGAAMVAMLM